MLKFAEDIEVDDVIMCFSLDGTPRRVGRIDPYDGLLASPRDGWRIATFVGGYAGGMTLIPGQTVEVA